MTACPTPDTTCNNAGLQYAVWNNSQTGDAEDFEPTLYKLDDSEFFGNGSTGIIGPIDAGTCDLGTVFCKSGTVYGTPTQSLGLVVIAHRGYLFAPLDGVYTLTVYNNDNNVLVWTQSDAYSGWTLENAALESRWPNPPNGLPLTLSAGEWFPIRIMYANGGGPGTFNVSITTHDGTEIAGSDVRQSPYLVQYSCDGAFPEYPPWNSET